MEDNETGLETDENGNLINLSRLDVLYGNPMDHPAFECDRCNSKKCRGENKCKGFGAWSYGIYL